jgi:hypothetical protein
VLVWISCFVIYLVYPQSRSFLTLRWLDFLSFYLMYLLLILVAIFSIRKSIHFSEMVLYILGVSFPVFLIVGSAAGISNVRTGFELLCGIAYVLLLKVAETYDCKKIFSVAGLVLLIILGFKGIKLVCFSDYRDAPVQNLAYTISSPRLKWIHTSQQRAQNINALIEQIEHYAKKGDQILVPDIPMIYYASGTLPLGNHCWLFLLDSESLAAKLKEISKTPPVLVIKKKIDYENPGQQQTKYNCEVDLDFMNDLRQKNDLFDQIILKPWHAKLIWSNDYFELYHPEGQNILGR